MMKSASMALLRKLIKEELQEAGPMKSSRKTKPSDIGKVPQIGPPIGNAVDMNKLINKVYDGVPALGLWAINLKTAQLTSQDRAAAKTTLDYLEKLVKQGRQDLKANKS